MASASTAASRIATRPATLETISAGAASTVNKRLRGTPMKPTVPDVMPLVRALYAQPLGGAGCCLHIVLDDCNVEDGCVQFCLEYAQKNGHPDCIALAELLMQMSKTQRRKLATG